MNEFDFEKSLGYLLSKTNAIMRLSFNKAINQNGLDASAEQWGILNIVKTFPGLTQSEIALRSLKDKTNVTRMLDVLEKKGCIERRSDKTDRRIYNIYITNAGKKLIEKIEPIANNVNQQAVKNLTPKETEQLRKLLNKLFNTLAE